MSQYWDTLYNFFLIIMFGYKFLFVSKYKVEPTYIIARLCIVNQSIFGPFLPWNLFYSFFHKSFFFQSDSRSSTFKKHKQCLRNLHFKLRYALNVFNLFQ